MTMHPNEYNEHGCVYMQVLFDFHVDQMVKQ